MRIVITDANVLINLATANGMTLLRDLPGHEFILPEEVRDEVIDEKQREQLDRATADGYLSVRRLESVDGLTLFVELRKTLGAGESACLAMAKVEGCLVASDEKRAFRREATRLLGSDAVVTTVDIYLMCIRAGIITVIEADSAKEILAANRFAMPFDSFSELLEN